MRRLVCALLLLVALPVRAQQLEVREMAFTEANGLLLTGVAFTDVFDAELLEQMASGFAQTIFVRLVLFREGQKDPVWATNATHRVVYAQWDEVYLVRLRDITGDRNLRFASRAEALKAVTTLQDLPVAQLIVVPPGKLHRLEVTVDVNPVAPELLAEVRRWLARPRGDKPAGDASFFGSFVSVFVNPRIADADRTLRFRSQDFYRGTR